MFVKKALKINYFKAFCQLTSYTQYLLIKIFVKKFHHCGDLWGVEIMLHYNIITKNVIHQTF
jgi:hypothetical protein